MLCYEFWSKPTEPAPRLQEFRLRSHLVTCNELFVSLLQPRPEKKIKVTDFGCVFLPSSSLRGHESIRAPALVIRLIWENCLKRQCDFGDFFMYKYVQYLFTITDVFSLNYLEHAGI